MPEMMLTLVERRFVPDPPPLSSNTPTASALQEENRTSGCSDDDQDLAQLLGQCSQGEEEKDAMMEALGYSRRVVDNRRPRSEREYIIDNPTTGTSDKMTLQIQREEQYQSAGSSTQVAMPPIFTEADELAEKASMTQEEVASSTADLYGLADSVANCHLAVDKDTMPEALYKLDWEIDQIPNKDKAPYLKALQQIQNGLSDDHKEVFLWTENLDAKLAAKRLVKYWELKRELFGDTKCFLPMMLLGGALQDHDVQAIKALYTHILPGKDMAGRGILYVNGWPDLVQCDHKRMLRAFWYICSVAIEDPEVQKLGVVFVIQPNKNGLQNPFQPELHILLTKLFEMVESCLPFRIRALHIIQPDYMVLSLLAFAKAVMGKQLRRRIHIHSGSKNEEVLSSLEGFGLLPKDLPTELGGVAVLEDLNAWVNSRKDLEFESKLGE